MIGRLAAQQANMVKVDRMKHPGYNSSTQQARDNSYPNFMLPDLDVDYLVYVF